jgi:predicted RNA binding protein YcfA (HicA-like mRNA interferase family)
MTSFKPREVIKILKKLGYLEKRQAGSHIIMFNPKNKKPFQFQYMQRS